jgi:hypothetical protein
MNRSMRQTGTIFHAAHVEKKHLLAKAHCILISVRPDSRRFFASYEQRRALAVSAKLEAKPKLVTPHATRLAALSEIPEHKTRFRMSR